MVYIYLICGYQTSRHQAIWQKTLLGKRLACLVDVVYQCIVVLSVTLLHFLGDGVSMHPCEADWTTTDGHYGKARLKEVLSWMRPHVLLWYVHNGCERITAGCEKLMACIQSTRKVHMHALQSEGKIILNFEIKVYFHPYYDMTLGYTSLGLVVVLF